MNTVKKSRTASTLIELTGHPFSMQKVYNLQALCTKIGVYWHAVKDENQVKLFNHFHFHQLQLKTNQNAWIKQRAHHCIF